MNAQQVWQSQVTDAPRISLEYVRHQARNLESRTRLRNALEYGTGVLAFLMFGFGAWQEWPAASHHGGVPGLVRALVSLLHVSLAR